MYYRFRQITKWFAFCPYSILFIGYTSLFWSFYWGYSLSLLIFSTGWVDNDPTSWLFHVVKSHSTIWTDLSMAHVLRWITGVCHRCQIDGYSETPFISLATLSILHFCFFIKKTLGWSSLLSAFCLQYSFLQGFNIDCYRRAWIDYLASLWRFLLSWPHHQSGNHQQPCCSWSEHHRSGLWFFG